MTLAAACAWSLLRSLAVALIGAVLARFMDAWWRGLSRQSRQVALALLAVALLFPGLLSGYAYSGGALLLAARAGATHEMLEWVAAHDQLLDELLLDLLLVARAFPMGMLVLFAAPQAPLSDAARHLARLGPARYRGFLDRCREAWWWLAYGEGRRIGVAWLLMWLLAFQEFELPSLLKRPAWTVWLFDAQVKGLPLAESLRLAAVPVACQVTVLAIALWIFGRKIADPGGARADPTGPAPPVYANVLCWGAVLAAIATTAVIPLAIVGRDTIQGVAFLFRNRIQLERLLRDIAIGAGLALVAAVAARAVAALGVRHRTAVAQVWLVAAVPGLFGSLVLGLALVGLMQLPGLHYTYRTGFSLVSGMTLALIPRAVLLELLDKSLRPRAALHAATILAASPDRLVRAGSARLIWSLEGRRRFWLLALLAGWGFLDLTIAYLLAPASIVSVPVLLYNQMHFARNAVLTAMTCLAVGVPVLLACTALAVRPFFFRWFRT